MSDSTNPFDPPVAAIARPGLDDVPAARRPRWHLLRWLPAALCVVASLPPGAYGGLICWETVPVLFHKLRDGRPPWGQVMLVGIGVFFLGLAAWSLRGAWDWASRRWARAAVAMVGVVVLFSLSLCVLASQAFFHFSRRLN